jgi:hypothetical protein
MTLIALAVVAYLVVFALVAWLFPKRAILIVVAAGSVGACNLAEPTPTQWICTTKPRCAYGVPCHTDSYVSTSPCPSVPVQ